MLMKVISPVVTILYLAPMGKKKNKSERPIKSSKDAEQALASDYIGGDALDELLSKLIRSVDVAKASRGGLPEKIWMKQQFAIGVNDVTRVLERMSPAATHPGHCSSEELTCTALRRAPLVPLQAVLVAADCNPKWLTKHIPTLASTRQVPILCLKDNKGSSLRLGQVVHVRTALAIGIKFTLRHVLRQEGVAMTIYPSAPIFCSLGNLKSIVVYGEDREIAWCKVVVQSIKNAEGDSRARVGGAWRSKMDTAYWSYGGVVRRLQCMTIF